jgi:hypothetical protein
MGSIQNIHISRMGKKVKLFNVKGWTGRIIHILRMAENPKVLNVKGWNVGDTIN